MVRISKKTCFVVASVVFALFLAFRYWPLVETFVVTALSAATPIFIGLAIAYVLNLLMGVYEAHFFPNSTKKAVIKSRRPLCITFSIFTLCAIIALIVWLVVPKLITCLGFLVAELPPLISRTLHSEWLAQVLPAATIAELSEIDWMAVVSKVFNTFGAGFGEAVNAIVKAFGSLISGIITTLLGIIFSVFLLYNKDTLQKQSRRVMGHYVPSCWQERLLHWLSVANSCFRGYIVGQVTEAVILGTLTMLGMVIFGFPYAGMVGAMTGFLALIPIAGAYISAITGALIMFTESPLKALLFLVFIVVLQQLEGNLIYPKVVGKSLKLPAIWVLVAITIGGGLFGILGMLVGVPIVATIYRLLREDMERREQEVPIQAEE